MGSYSEKDILDILLNPFYAIVFKDTLFKKTDRHAAKEDWVSSNAKLIKKDGCREWLVRLLASLSGEADKNEDLKLHEYIVFSKRLQGEHMPMITREMWLDINEKTIKEIGETDWLRELLEVLETGGPAPTE